jgi:flavin-dependent dehydrogenase
MHPTTSPDILVMGGGPAGTAAGCFLARLGFSVLLLEADAHPRHHIGESLLPGTIPILHRLGIPNEQLAARFQPKFGARFYDPASDQMATFGFEPTPGSVSPAFQVLREEFDALLADRARAAGCQLWENAFIERFELDPPRVWLRDGRCLAARFLVDASGRAALIASRRGERRIISDYGRLGLYCYFDNLPSHDAHDPDFITMYVFDGGWVWLIPLRDGRTSVGIVFRDPPSISETGQARIDALFWNGVQRMPRLQQRLQAARIVQPIRALADYSFVVGQKFGPGWAAVGDAGGFLDPIFSSGVHLALSSADLASAAIAEKLRTGSDLALRDYARHMDAGFQVFQAFVHRFYNRDLVHNLFFMPSKPPHIHTAITRILAGRVWDQENPVIRMLQPAAPQPGKE